MYLFCRSLAYILCPSITFGIVYLTCGVTGGGLDEQHARRAARDQVRAGGELRQGLYAAGAQDGRHAQVADHGPGGAAQDPVRHQRHGGDLLQ